MLTEIPVHNVLHADSFVRFERGDYLVVHPHGSEDVYHGTALNDCTGGTSIELRLDALSTPTLILNTNMCDVEVRFRASVARRTTTTTDGKF